MCASNAHYIREKIRVGINNFIVEHFFRNPYDYLFERDIQSHLFVILRQQLKDELPIELPNKSKSFSDMRNFKLNLIYTEYSSSKIDICCIDPDHIADIDQYGALLKPTKLDKDPLWDQPLLCGIEIKLIRPGYENTYEGFKKDIEKMEQYKMGMGDKGNNYSPDFQYLVLNFLLEPKIKIMDDIRAPQFAKKVDAIGSYNSAYMIAYRQENNIEERYLGQYVGDGH